MYPLFIIVHVVVCLVLCVAVLLQSSKGGGLAGAFGGSGGMPQQILGTRGMTTLLHKLTIYFGVAFFVSSFMLFILTGNRTGGAGSIVQDAAREGSLTSDVTTEPLTGDDPFQIPAVEPATEQAVGDDGEPGSGSGQGNGQDDPEDPQ